jgi:hypothetical protein
VDKSLEVSLQKFVGKSRSEEGRWADCLVFAPEDRGLLERRGRLYAVLDLKGNPNLGVGRLGNRGLSVLKERYYLSNKDSPLLALEEAVRASRESLWHEAFGGKKAGAESVLEVNFALASLWGAVLYVVKLGSAAVYLRRAGKFKELGGRSSEKIFTASGVVHEGDRLLLGSSVFARSFSGEEQLADLGNPPGFAALALDFQFKRTPTEKEILRIRPLRERRSVLRDLRGFLARKKIFRLALGGAILLLFLAASVFTIKKRQQNFRAEEVARLTATAEQKVAEAQDFVDLNNLKARELLLAARESLKKAQEIDPRYVEAAPKIKEINALLDKVGNVTRLSKLDLLYDLKIFDEAAQPDSLTLLSGRIYLGDSAAGSLYELELADPPVVRKVLDKEVLGIKDVYGFEGQIFFVSADGAGVYNPQTGELRKNLLETELPTADLSDLKVFLGNIYLLLPSQGMILKSVPVGRAYSVPRNWFESAASLDSASSMAIDGFIYVLTRGGEIKKFEQGVLAGDFKVKGLDKPFSNPSKIFTTSDSEYLYVLDSGNKRVVLIRKTGFYDSQYVYEGKSAFKETKDLFVDEDAGLIYLLDGSKIFKIPL